MVLLNNCTKNLHLINSIKKLLNSIKLKVFFINKGCYSVYFLFRRINVGRRFDFYLTYKSFCSLLEFDSGFSIQIYSNVSGIQEITFSLCE